MVHACELSSEGQSTQTQDVNGSWGGGVGRGADETTYGVWFLSGLTAASCRGLGRQPAQGVHHQPLD